MMTPFHPTRTARIADKAELIVSGLFFAVMLGVVVANVFMRYLFDKGLLFTEELAYIGFTWSVFAAIAWLYRSRLLISVDVFFDMLPLAVRRVASVLVDLSLVVANLWFCWLSWVLAQGGFIRKTPVLEVPYFWINLAPLLAFALMAIYSAIHLVQGIRGRTHDPDRVEQVEMLEGSSL